MSITASYLFTRYKQILLGVAGTELVANNHLLTNRCLPNRGAWHYLKTDLAFKIEGLHFRSPLFKSRLNIIYKEKL